jgi:probable HAF family extracellular repeat protein
MNKRSGRFFPLVVAALIVSAVVLPIPSVAQQSFTLTDLGFLPGNSPFKESGSLGINNAGQVVGFSYLNEYYISSGGFTFGYIDPVGFFWDPVSGITAIFQSMFPDSGYITNATAINDVGTIAGVVRPLRQSLQPFLLPSSGTPQMLPAGANGGYVGNLNNSNLSVGYTTDTTFDNHAALWMSDGTLVNLNPPGGDSQANDINAAGQVVGTSNTGSSDPPNLPFVWDSVHGTQILSYSGVGGGAWGINTQGDIAGFLELVAGHAQDHAAIWHNGVPTDIHPFGVSSQALGINAAGQVIGNVTLANGTSYAFYSANGTAHLILAMLDTSVPFNRFTVTGINADGKIIGEASNVPPNSNVVPQPHAVLLTPSSIVLPHPGDVTISLGIRVSALRYDPTSKLWVRTVSLTNKTRNAITGPLNVVLDNVSFYMTPQPTGVVLATAPLGASYFSVNAGTSGKLAPGQTLTVPFSFPLPALLNGTNFNVVAVLAGSGRP